MYTAYILRRVKTSNQPPVQNIVEKKSILSVKIIYTLYMCRLLHMCRKMFFFLIFIHNNIIYVKSLTKKTCSKDRKIKYVMYIYIYITPIHHGVVYTPFFSIDGFLQNEKKRELSFISEQIYYIVEDGVI